MSLWYCLRFLVFVWNWIVVVCEGYIVCEWWVEDFLEGVVDFVGVGRSFVLVVFFFYG